MVAAKSETKIEGAEERIVEGVQLQNGRIRLVSRTLPVGTSLSVYVNGHLVGAGALAAFAAGNDVAQCVDIDLKTLPPIEFPFEFRFADDATGGEAHASLLVKDVHEFVAAMGDEPAGVTLEALYEDRMDFAFDVGFAPETGRRLALKINGRKISQGLSKGASAKSGSRVRHSISLDLTVPFRDGSVVELVDIQSGRTVFRQIPTWTDIVGALTLGQKTLHSRLETLERDVQKMSVSMSLLSGQGRERLLLDRLDMFYALIQDRLDKELRVLNPPSRGGQDLPVPADRDIGAAEIEGTGYYALEGHGAVRWRWFGPNVSFVVRDVSARARELHLAFFSVDAACREGDIRIKANGCVLEARAVRTQDRVEITAALGRNVFGGAAIKSLIVEVDFPYHFQPAGDNRVLSAAFSNVSVRH